MIAPFSDGVLVRRVEPKKMTEGGIVIPDAHQQELDQGTVVAIGPGRFYPGTGERIPCECSKGDTVIYGRYAGKEVEHDGETLLLMRESDLLGKVESKSVEIRL